MRAQKSSNGHNSIPNPLVGHAMNTLKESLYHVGWIKRLETSSLAYITTSRKKSFGLSQFLKSYGEFEYYVFSWGHYFVGCEYLY